jgi:hypothetical protein
MARTGNVNNHGIIEIGGEIRHETEKAYQLFDGDKEVDAEVARRMRSIRLNDADARMNVPD